jgi:hypothetical protein
MQHLLGETPSIPPPSITGYRYDFALEQFAVLDAEVLGCPFNYCAVHDTDCMIGLYKAPYCMHLSIVKCAECLSACSTR